MPQRPVRAVSLPPLRSALTAPIRVAAWELRSVLAQPGPTFGGAAGTVVLCALLFGLFAWMPNEAEAEGEPEFVVEFLPGLAVEAPAQAEPESEPEAPAGGEPEPDLEPEPESDPDAVTETESSPPKPPRPEPTPKPPEPSPTPTPSTNPLTDADGWADAVAAGDPWAASVMKALQAMQVPAWGGQIPQSSPYRFRVQVCKDGSVRRVLQKGSTGDTHLDATLKHEIERLSLPRMSAAMAKHLGGECATLGYSFAWTQAGVR